MHDQGQLTDKDLTERKTLPEEFLDAELQLCLFHMLRSFKHEFSLDKLRKSSGRWQMRSRHIEQYEVLKNLGVRAAVDFFEKNWLPIKEQWATCNKNSKFTLRKLTNNRLESMNSKIKSVCSKFTSLSTFFSEFLDVLRVLRGERNHSYIVQDTCDTSMRSNLRRHEVCHIHHAVCLFTHREATAVARCSQDTRRRWSSSEGPIIVFPMF